MLYGKKQGGGLAEKFGGKGKGKKKKNGKGGK